MAQIILPGKWALLPFRDLNEFIPIVAASHIKVKIVLVMYVNCC
jgi:hypothetical protein